VIYHVELILDNIRFAKVKLILIWAERISSNPKEL